MRANSRANQGGSIVSFIIVGTLLLAGLGAGVYYISRDDSAPESQVSEPVADTDNSESTDRDPIAEGGTVADPDEERSDSQAAEAPASEPEESAPATSESSDEATPSEPEQIASAGGSGSVDELPQSGPAEIMLSLVALFSVTFIVAAFRRSRHALASEINGRN